MKIGRGVSELWRVENRHLPLTWPMAYTTACTTVQAVISIGQFYTVTEIGRSPKLIQEIAAVEHRFVTVCMAKLRNPAARINN